MNHDVIGAEETLPVGMLGGRPYRRAASRANTVPVGPRRTAGIRVVGVEHPVLQPAQPARRSARPPTIHISAAPSNELATVGLILLAALVAGTVSGFIAFNAFLG